MHRRHAFTLIELLVVIAIIALLVGILLPAMASARASARGSVCLSNMRQLVVGLSSYADSHKGVFPAHRPPRLTGATANPANWYQVGNGLKYRPTFIAAMSAYVGIDPFAEPSTSDERQDFVSPVFTCPEASQRTDERNAAYGYNYQFLGNARLVAGRSRNWPVNLSSISATSQTIVMADSMGTASGFARDLRTPYANNGSALTDIGNHAYTLDPPRLGPASDRGTGDVGSPRMGAEPRHQRASASVFVDGHAALLTLEAMGYVLNPDGSFADEATNPGTGSRGPSNALFSGTGQDILAP
ncbi:MAG: type II secretion system protein [Phycisphaerales bacterium]|jgi:prepilin-type N-terminal cleavage/methylation domain-containing protein|nr:prepilin-type N-terminal cleavage/methylation domain-containing protein [Phycisphaeraceae bacterium]